MEPIFMFITAFVLALLAAVIAAKRGRSGWVFLLVAVFGSLVTTTAMSFVTRANEYAMMAGLMGFPAIVVIAALAVRSSDQMEAENGSFRGKRKCPQCAERILAEAKKCKHCGTDVEPAK
ncbi:MAG: zinc ribbon domain-containing protein [Paenalcaligenes sp.]